MNVKLMYVTSKIPGQFMANAKYILVEREFND